MNRFRFLLVFLLLPFALGACGSSQEAASCSNDDDLCPPGCAPESDNDCGELQWQDPPAESAMTWQEAIDYCESLSEDGFSDWHLPNIDELRSLIRGCSDTETEGSCAIDGDCLSHDDCWNDPCIGCLELEGPANGCYWREDLQGACDCYWSSSLREDGNVGRWGVFFTFGRVNNYFKDNPYSVRCVRRVIL